MLKLPNEIYVFVPYVDESSDVIKQFKAEFCRDYNINDRSVIIKSEKPDDGLIRTEVTVHFDNGTIAWKGGGVIDLDEQEMELVAEENQLLDSNKQAEVDWDKYSEEDFAWNMFIQNLDSLFTDGHEVLNSLIALKQSGVSVRNTVLDLLQRMAMNRSQVDNIIKGIESGETELRSVPQK